MTMTKPTSEQVTFTAAGSGATMRNLSDKLNDLASVKDFGAVGNGIADDTTALQAAFNYATANGKGLFFPSGTYRVTSTIVIDQNNSGNLFLGEGTSVIRWYGSDTNTDMIRIYNAFFTTFDRITFRGLTNTTLVNMRGDVLGFPRPDGRAAERATFLNCQFRGGKYQLRWTTKDRDFNNEQGIVRDCQFIEPYRMCISIEHSNSLWHQIIGCSFAIGLGSQTWAINTVDDQGGNSYVDPAYDFGYGGSGLFIDNCVCGSVGFLRLGGMRYATTVTNFKSEGMTDFVYTPTGIDTFTASITSGNTTVTNVTNVAQLSAGDYFWNRHVPLGTKISSVDVGTSTLVLDTAPTGTQSNSKCDAGLCSPIGTIWQLYMRNIIAQWDPNGAVTPLIALDTSSGGSGLVPVVIDMENARLSAGNATQPMFIFTDGPSRGYVSFHDWYGEPSPIRIGNCDVSAGGAFAWPSSINLASTCRLNSTATNGIIGSSSNCFVDNGVLFTQAGGSSESTKFLPSGDMRVISASYPAAPADITAISGVPVGYIITIQFGGQLTLKHSAALALAGGADIRPPNGASMKFVGTAAGVSELSRDFNTYKADVTDTATNIASIASTVNTVGKYAGKVVWDSTNTRLMRSDGASAGSAWRVIDGSASVTPS